VLCARVAMTCPPKERVVVRPSGELRPSPCGRFRVSIKEWCMQFGFTRERTEHR
jgi:hypothetical protein